MSSTVTQPRQTQDKDVECVICDAVTPASSAFCHNCSAPLEVSHAVTHRGTPSQFVPILGPSGAGKTVYLGLLLDMLSQGSSSLRGVPNGPFSLAVQQETIHALQNRRFPEKTRSEADDWRWVHCEVTQVNRPKRVTDIITPDLAGEAIALEIDRPGSYPIIGSVISRSEGLILLFDSMRTRDNGRDEDLFAMKLLSYLENRLRKEGALRKKIRTPVSFVYTKSDSCPESMEDPEEFARAMMPGFFQASQRYFANYRFFAAGIVGSYAVATDGYGRRSQIPLHIQPHGILEPLEWLVSR